MQEHVQDGFRPCLEQCRFARFYLAAVALKVVTEDLDGFAVWFVFNRLAKSRISILLSSETLPRVR